MVKYSNRIINYSLFERLTLAKKSSIFVCKMCVVVSRPMKYVNSFGKTVTSRKGLLVFF